MPWANFTVEQLILKSNVNPHHPANPEALLVMLRGRVAFPSGLVSFLFKRYLMVPCYSNGNKKAGNASVVAPEM